MTKFSIFGQFWLMVELIYFWKNYSNKWLKRNYILVWIFGLIFLESSFKFTNFLLCDFYVNRKVCGNSQFHIKNTLYRKCFRNDKSCLFLMRKYFTTIASSMQVWMLRRTSLIYTCTIHTKLQWWCQVWYLKWVSDPFQSVTPSLNADSDARSERGLKI